MNVFDHLPDESTPISSPLRIFLNVIFVGSALLAYP